jgi:hypothetical protein
MREWIAVVDFVAGCFEQNRRHWLQRTDAAGLLDAFGHR